MASNNNKKYIKHAYSKQPLRAYSPNKDFATVFPDFNFRVVLDLVDKDPVASGAIQHFVDKCMEGEYSIIHTETNKLNNKKRLGIEKKFNFRHAILRKLFEVGKLFNNVFVEIVRDSDGRTKALNILDGTNLEAITEPNGDLKKLKSQLPNPESGEYAEWSKDDIVWFKFGDRDGGYAHVDIRALYENLLTKQYVTRYVAWLWKTGQYRILYNPKNASDADIEDFLSFLRRHDDNFTQPFIFKGELETKLLREMKEIDSLTSYLKHLDNQTLILLRVPPNDAGIPDASGRSNADAQANNLGTSVSSFQQAVEDVVNFDLFKKISMGEYLLKFGPIDRFALKQVFEMLQIMKSMNMTDEACEEFLKSRGVYFDSKLFQDPMAMMVPNDNVNPRTKDNAPSRIGKGAGEGNAPDGSGGQTTTREDQLKKV